MGPLSFISTFHIEVACMVIITDQQRCKCPVKINNAFLWLITQLGSQPDYYRPARPDPNRHPTSGNRIHTNWIGSQKEENHACKQSTNQRKNGPNTTNNKRKKPMERRNKKPTGRIQYLRWNPDRKQRNTQENNVLWKQEQIRAIC